MCVFLPSSTREETILVLRFMCVHNRCSLPLHSTQTCGQGNSPSLTKLRFKFDTKFIPYDLPKLDHEKWCFCPCHGPSDTRFPISDFSFQSRPFFTWCTCFSRTSCSGNRCKRPTIGVVASYNPVSVANRWYLIHLCCFFSSHSLRRWHFWSGDIRNRSHTLLCTRHRIERQQLFTAAFPLR